MSSYAVKATNRAIIAICACLSATSFAQELASNAPTAASEAPALDTNPLSDPPERPERTDPDASEPPGPTVQLSSPEPVLDSSQPAVAPSDLVGKRADQKWRVIPFGRFKTTFDDNLFISSTNPESDLYFTLTPGVAVGWGDYAKEVQQLGEFEHYFEVPELDPEDKPQAYAFAKYLASASVFSDHSDQNAIDHDALVSGRWEWAKLRLDGRLYFKTLSGSDVEIGNRVKRTLFGGALTSTYDISQKTSLELSLSNDSYNYDAGVDWMESVVGAALNYQILPKTRVAVGTRVGYVDIKGGNSQTYQAVVGSITFASSAKLALSLDGGLELREYGSGASDSYLPLFDVAATYQPFDGTSIAGNAYRRTAASVSLIDENITSTGVAARLRQRFLHRFYLGLESGYDHSEFDSTTQGATRARSDDRIYVKPSISFDVTKYLSAESSYEYQHNDSSLSDFTFTENLFTVQLNLQF